MKFQEGEPEYFKALLDNRKRQILKNIDGVHDELGQLR